MKYAVESYLLQKETIIPWQWIRYFDLETFTPAALPSGSPWASPCCQQQKTQVLACCWHYSGKVGKQLKLLLLSLPPSQLVNVPSGIWESHEAAAHLPEFWRQRRWSGGENLNVRACWFMPQKHKNQNRDPPLSYLDRKFNLKLVCFLQLFYLRTPLGVLSTFSFFCPCCRKTAQKELEISLIKRLAKNPPKIGKRSKPMSIPPFWGVVGITSGLRFFIWHPKCHFLALENGHFRWNQYIYIT